MTDDLRPGPHRGRFRASWITFLLAPIPAFLSPLLCLAVDDGRPGYHQLGTFLLILLGGLALGLLLLLTSFLTGIGTVRERKIALLWVIPGGAVLSAAIVGLAVHLIGPHWDASWL